MSLTPNPSPLDKKRSSGEGSGTPLLPTSFFLILGEGAGG